MQTGNYRIVAEKAGACILGFRVQKEQYRRGGDSVGETYWRNRGRRCFSPEAADRLRELLIQQDQRQERPQVEYVEVTGPIIRESQYSSPVGRFDRGTPPNSFEGM
jgi:hypothetical protein